MQGKLRVKRNEVVLTAARTLHAEQRSHFVNFIPAQRRCKATSSSSEICDRYTPAILISRLGAHLCFSSMLPKGPWKQV